MWVTELFAHHEDSTPFGDLRVMAEALFETTSSPEDLDFITIRLPTLFFSMPPEHSGRTAFEAALQNPQDIKNDSLYPPFIRESMEQRRRAGVGLGQPCE
jgi:hypothetical protein